MQSSELAEDCYNKNNGKLFRKAYTESIIEEGASMGNQSLIESGELRNEAECGAILDICETSGSL